MRGRRMAVAAAAVAAVVGAAAPAGAAAPTEIRREVAGASFTCGDRHLTVVAGALVGQRHRRQLDDGRVRVTFQLHLEDVAAVDQDGVPHRFHGGVNASYTVDPAIPGSEVGHHTVHETITGPGGLVGTVSERLRATRDGEVELVDRSTCTPA